MANITILEALQLSLNTTKKYVDDKTEILPVKGNYTIFEDAVPSRTEVASNGLEYYIFDSLQNEDMIISAVKYNLNVTFNDGTNDRTMDLIIERSLKDGVFCEKDGFAVEVSYSETNHAIEMVLINANDYTQYSILKATLNCDSYSNLLQDYHIENINYDKIKEVPTALNNIANYKNFTLKGKEYYELYDNLSIWDANKFNERLDENSGVKRNEFFKLLGKDKYTMRIKQKDSEGIGFGQHISIDNSKNVHIVADAGVDVIIKIYNSTTKELIETLNYCEAGFYKTRIINKDYLNGVTSIFIAFTVKDSTESFYGNTYVNDLIVHYDSSFLVKEDILTKTNTKEYTPTEDYNPATKKYVDDKVAGVNASTITGLATVATSGSYNDLTNKPIIPSIEGLATETYVNNKVSGLVDSAPEALNTLNELATALGNDANFSTTVATEIGRKVDKIDGKSLSTNDLTNELKANYDAAYTHSTSAHAPSNAQANADITKAEIEAKLTGDITSHTHNQYLTEHQDISGLAPKANPSFTGNATVAGKVTVGTAPTEDMDVATKEYVDDNKFSGSYNDLTNKPTIPTTTSQLTNDSGYITSSSIPSSLPANGGNADTVGGYTIWVGTQAQYNAITSKSSTTIYLIKEG